MHWEDTSVVVLEQTLRGGGIVCCGGVTIRWIEGPLKHEQQHGAIVM